VANTEPVILSQAALLAGVSTPFTQTTIGDTFYPETADETTASVTIADKRYPEGHVARYGTNTSPGTTDMTTPIQDARKVIDTKGGGTIVFNPEVYKVWVSSSPDLMAFTNTDGVTIEGNGATITSGRTNGPGVFVVKLTGCHNTIVRNIKLVGSNTTLTASTGEGLVIMYAGTRNTTIINTEASNCNTWVGCGDGTAPPAIDHVDRVSGIIVLGGYTNKCFYGVQTAGNGDNLFVRGYKSFNAGRSYFPWNVKNHDVELESTHGAGFSDCLLKVYCDSSFGYNRLENIKLKYQCDGQYTSGAAQFANDANIAFDIQQWDSGSNQAGEVSNIDIEFNISTNVSVVHRRAFVMRRYNYDGTNDSTSRSHIFINWKISGRVKGGSNMIEDIVSIFPTTLGTWTGDFASGWLLENLYIAGSSQNGLVIDQTPFSGVYTGLCLRNVLMDVDYSTTGGGGGAIPVSYDNFVAANMKTRASATYDPASLADGAGVTTTVTCTGAVLGDAADCSFSLDLQGIVMTAYVSAADTVSVRFQNESTGTIDLGSGTIRVWLRKN
jgi:hypothetical protein